MRKVLVSAAVVLASMAYAGGVAFISETFGGWWFFVLLIGLPLAFTIVSTIHQHVVELAHVITLAHQRGRDDKSGSRELVLSNSAQAHWAEVYSELTRDYPGILGAVTSRQEAHARRLALTYAQLDGAERIEIDHLEAALAFCRYAFDSAAYLFGETELNPIAQKIMDGLATVGPKTQTEIMGLFQRNIKADDLTAVLRDLQERGRITLTTIKTGERGRPASVWSINERNE